MIKKKGLILPIKIDGTEQVTKLKDSIVEIPDSIKKVSSQMNEMNTILKDANTLSKVLNDQTVLLEKNRTAMDNTMIITNQLQKTNNDLIFRNINDIKESIVIYDHKINFEKKEAAEYEKVWDATKNTGARVVEYFVSTWSVAKDVYDNASDYIKAFFEDVEKYKSQLNENVFYNQRDLDRNDEIEEKKRRKKIKTLKGFEKEKQEIILESQLKLKEIEDNRRKLLKANKSEVEDRPINIFKYSPALDRLEIELKNQKTNAAMDKYRQEVLKNAEEQDIALQKIYGGSLEDQRVFVARANDVYVEAYAVRSKNAQQHEQNTVKLTKEQEENILNIFSDSNKDIIGLETQQQKELQQIGKDVADKKLQDQQKTNDLLIQNLESFNSRKDELLNEAQQSMANFAEANKKTDNAILESTDNTAVTFEEKWKKINATMQRHVDIIMTGVNAIFSATNALLNDQLEEANEKYEAIAGKYSEAVEQHKESNDRLSELEEQAKNARGGRSLILQEQINQEMAKNQQLAQQEKNLAKEKEKAEKEKEKKEKQIKKSEISQGIIQGIANTALGVTKAWSLGPIIGPIMAALVGVAGAIQVGVMTKQLSKLENGGLLNGKRHAHGGMRIEGTNIEVEGGEYVVNRESTSKNLGLVRYINSQHKELTPTDINGFFSKASQSYEPPFRRMFESGGQMPAISSPNTIDNDVLVDAIKSIKISPKVAVTDILRVQDEMVQVDSWSGN